MERDSDQTIITSPITTCHTTDTTDYLDCLELVFFFPISSNREPGSFLFSPDLLELVERAGCSARENECARQRLVEKLLEDICPPDQQSGPKELK